MVPVEIAVDTAALKLCVNVVPQLSKSIVTIWVVLELDAHLQLLLQRLSNMATIDEAQRSSSKLEQEDEDHQNEVRGEHAPALEPGSAAPQEGHEEGDGARGEAEAVGAKYPVGGQQRRVAAIRHVQPHAHACHTATQNPEEQVVAAECATDTRVARPAHGPTAGSAARIRVLS